MINFDAVNRGDLIPEYSVTIDEARYFEYNRLVNEINPLHFHEEYARKLGFRDPVVAGVFTFSFIPGYIERWTGKPGSCRRIEVRFIKPVYINDTIKLSGKIIKIYSKENRNFAECCVRVENDGALMIEAEATVEV